jgi:hypothetical protein
MRRVLWVIAAVTCFPQLASADIFGSSWERDRDSAISCFQSVNQDPAFQPIFRKLPPSDPSLDQLSDASLPTAREIQLIRVVADRKLPCRNLQLTAVEKHHRWLKAAVELRYFQIDLVYVQLFQGRVTFGNANKLLQESNLEFKAREEQYFQARSDEQRRALAESMRDLSRQAQSSPPPSGSGRMTCRWIGPTLYCDSY